MLATKNNSKMITQLSKKCKIKRLSNLDVSEFLVANNIKNENEPVTKACKQNDAGERILQMFLSLFPNSLLGPIATTLKMQFRTARSRGDHASKTN